MPPGAAPTWADVVVVILTVEERAATYGALVAQVSEACPGAMVLTHQHLHGTPARVDFPQALDVAAARAAHFGRRWILQFEDDVVLAPTFGVEALAAGLDDVDVLSLFSRSRADTVARARGENVRRIAPAAFSMSQAFFITWELAGGVAAFAPAWYRANPQHNRAADLLLAAYLSHAEARVRVRVPSLVQHRRGPSTLPGHHGARQSESYRATFGDLEGES